MSTQFNIVQWQNISNINYTYGKVHALLLINFSHTEPQKINRTNYFKLTYLSEFGSLIEVEEEKTDYSDLDACQ